MEWNSVDMVLRFIALGPALTPKNTPDHPQAVEFRRWQHRRAASDQEENYVFAVAL
jgi:hypothetical protein